MILRPRGKLIHNDNKSLIFLKDLFLLVSIYFFFFRGEWVPKKGVCPDPWNPSGSALVYDYTKYTLTGYNGILFRVFPFNTTHSSISKTLAGNAHQNTSTDSTNLEFPDHTDNQCIHSSDLSWWNIDLITMIFSENKRFYFNLLYNILLVYMYLLTFQLIIL